MIGTLMRACAPRGARSRLSILIFHRVLPAPDPLQPDEPDVVRFEQEMRWIGQWCTVLPLDEAIERLARGELPPMATAITFDDGYADNATLALPILQKLGLTATFFIATGFLDGGRMWNDTVIEAVRAHRSDELDLERIGLGRTKTESPASKRALIGALLRAIKHFDPAERDDRVAAIAEAVGAPLPDDLMMTRSMVRALRDAGMSLGGHTVRHPILRSVSDAEAEREIAEGRDALREISGEKVRLFAYPNGVPDADYQSRHVALVKGLGFDAAVCTAFGAAVRGSDRYQLPRFRPWDRTAPRYALRFARNLMYTRSALAA